MAAGTLEKRPLGALGRMTLVGALHLGAIFIIARSFGIVPSLAPETLEGRIIPEERIIPEDPVPVPDPDFRQRPDDLTLPEPDMLPLPAEQPVVITAPPADETRERPRPDGDAIVRLGPTAVHPDGSHPLTQPPYPSSAIRAGSEGFVDIEVYVLPSGRVGDARVIKSTGFNSLDQSALDEAKRKWRLVPATVDGVPVAQWHRLRVVFKLNNPR